MLVLTEFTIRDYDVARERIRMLVEMHSITHVVLIAHEDCGFYRMAMPDADAHQLRLTQEQHLHDAAHALQAWFPMIKVELYYAAVRNGRVVFVDVSQ